MEDKKTSMVVTTIKKIIKNLDYYISVICMMFVTIVCFATVISRKVFGQTSSSLDEINMIIFICFLYATIVYAVRKEKHIRVEILDVYLSEKNRIRLKFLADSIWLIFTVYLTYVAIALVLFNTKYVAKTPMLDIPMFLVYSIVPISFFAMSILLAINLKKRAGKLKTLINRDLEK